MTDYNDDPDYQRMLADMTQDAIDLGLDVYIRFYERDRARAGFTEVHKRPDGKWCAGGVAFDIPEMAGFNQAKWTVNSIEPLDISPSVLCRDCGHHGFVRQGRWVPA